jgi:excinuclease ABC subunit A
MRTIRIRGAREHNLRNVSLEIPRDALVVVTGVSGSGKSSLAFDTLYAEGQRRYVESLSAYARQFLEQMDKPDVDAIEGLSPAIAIEQRSASKNPRSTVGTVTEIHDYLRLLFARIGKPHCPTCGVPIEAQTVQQMADRLLKLPEGTRITLTAPVVRGRKGEYRKLFEEFVRRGFTRMVVDKETIEVPPFPELDKHKKHTIEVVVDRLVVKEGVKGRLTDSLELALKLSEGMAEALTGGGERLVFNEKLVCPTCGWSLSELSPRMFSYNNPWGACPRCDGLGTRLFIDPAKVIPDPSSSLRDGAVRPWARRGGLAHASLLSTLAKRYRFSLYTPVRDLPPGVVDLLLLGNRRKGALKDPSPGERPVHFEGIIPEMERRRRETDSQLVRDEIASYMSSLPCSACGGARLRPEALAVTVGGRTIDDFSRMMVGALAGEFSSLSLPPTETEIASRILREIGERLSFLVSVGLDYLTLARSAATLSGGEAQRIRLATQVGSGLVGVLYILDEPSIGLHQRDNQRLLSTLFRLRDLGNTVVVVEHDEATIRASDWVVDLGPGAGELGGEVIYGGPPSGITAEPRSLTGRYLSGNLAIPAPAVRRPHERGELIVRGATANNLKGIDIGFPLGVLTCVTGVSGSGKSSLVIDILYQALAGKLFRSSEPVGRHDAIEGMERIDKVIDVDQSPIGRTPRSNPATYTGLFTPIRELFAQLPESRARGYDPGRFSFNVKGGRCEACQGDGVQKIEMHFLPDIYVTCESCEGRRFNRETLEIAYRGKSIAAVLDMTVREAVGFFSAHPAIERKLATLADVGLDYVRLGQPATTLSGGEAQRIKLSRELGRRDTGNTVYILDEPTTGLHFADIARLLQVLDRLVAEGNTVIVIEHNLDVLASADWIIDLGPEGGEAGGRLVVAGTPEEVAAAGLGHTARYLAPALAEKHGAGRLAH